MRYRLKNSRLPLHFGKYKKFRLTNQIKYNTFYMKQFFPKSINNKLFQMTIVTRPVYNVLYMVLSLYMVFHAMETSYVFGTVATKLNDLKWSMFKY